jgi:glycosyltransferase involved in cell wall biosynthesis
MAHGLPSVVTDSCGIPEIVGQDGAAVTLGRGPQLVTQLTDALEHLLLDPAARARMGAVARHRVEHEFLWSHVVDRMAPALQHVAERSRAA